MTKDEIVARLAFYKAEGLKVDPRTTKVCFSLGPDYDPYNLYPEPGPDDEHCVAQHRFALSPDGVWVSWWDLPRKTMDALQARLMKGRPQKERRELLDELA